MRASANPEGCGRPDPHARRTGVRTGKGDGMGTRRRRAGPDLPRGALLLASRFGPQGSSRVPKNLRRSEPLKRCRAALIHSARRLTKQPRLKDRDGRGRRQAGRRVPARHNPGGGSLSGRRARAGSAPRQPEPRLAPSQATASQGSGLRPGSRAMPPRFKTPPEAPLADGTGARLRERLMYVKDHFHEIGSEIR